MQLKQHGTQKVMCVRVIWIERGYLLETFQGLGILRFDAVQNPQRVPDMRILWIQGRSVFERLLSLRHFLQIDQRDAAVHLSMDQRRVQLERIPKFSSRFFQQLLVHERRAQVVRLGGFRLFGLRNIRMPGACAEKEWGDEQKAREGATTRQKPGKETHSAPLAITGLLNNPPSTIEHGVRVANGGFNSI